MVKWNFFKRSEVSSNLHFYEVIFSDDVVFGVTAETGQKAEELVCDEVYHDQTIPGIPVVNELDFKEIKKKYTGASFKKVLQKGIWYIS